mgnify:CR=1 FL=1
MNLTAKAQAGFHATFGYSPTGVWSAPGRANLIGEHTDYNNGFVLPFGINYRTYAAVSLRTDRICKVVSEIDSKVYEISLDDVKPTDLDWALYPLGVAWVMREYATWGFDCYITSDVPIGAGLSSSAAIESAMASALNELWGANLERKQLALIGQKAENQVVGAPTGIMDQTASMMAQDDAAVLIDCQDLDITVVDLGLSKHDLVVAVIDTQVSHSHAHGGYGSRRTSCEVGAKQLGDFFGRGCFGLQQLKVLWKFFLNLRLVLASQTFQFREAQTHGFDDLWVDFLLLRLARLRHDVAVKRGEFGLGVLVKSRDFSQSRFLDGGACSRF